MTRGWLQKGQVFGRMLRAGTPELPIVQYAVDASPSSVQWKEVCAWVGDHALRPSPVVLSLEVQGLQPGVGSPRTSDVPGLLDVRACPPPWNVPFGMQGCALVEYAVWGRVSRRWIDLRSGSYQLPPCHSASVAVRAYQPPELDPPVPLLVDTWTVGASLAPGRTSQPRDATYSGVYLYEGGGVGANLGFPLPPGTQGVRVGLLGTGDTVAQVRGTQPYVTIGPSPDYQPAVADLVPASTDVNVSVSGDDEAGVLVEALVAW